MGAGFVFLHRTGERAARQFQQTLQARAVSPENAGLGFREAAERQLQVAGALQYRMRSLGAQPEALRKSCNLSCQ